MSTEASHLKQEPAANAAPRSHRRRRRAGVCLLLTVTGASLGILSLLPQAPALIWNFTPSVPVGLYSVSQTAPAKGDLVAIAPAGATRSTLDTYGVLPSRKILLKQLTALRGDVVCRQETSITVNGVVAATARLRSNSGRTLPGWSGCRVLGDNDVLVLAPHALSFDGRYLGPVDAGQIVGVAKPLLTFPLEGES